MRGCRALQQASFGMPWHRRVLGLGPKAAQRWTFGREMTADSKDFVKLCTWGFGCFFVGDLLGQLHTQRKFLLNMMAKSDLGDATPYSYDARVNAGLRASKFHPFTAAFFAAFVYAPLRRRFFARLDRVWPLPDDRARQGYAIALRLAAEHATLVPVTVVAYFATMGLLFDWAATPSAQYERNRRKVMPALLGTWALGLSMQGALYWIVPRFLWGAGVHATTIFWAGYLSKVDFAPP